MGEEVGVWGELCEGFPREGEGGLSFRGHDCGLARCRGCLVVWVFRLELGDLLF